MWTVTRIPGRNGLIQRTCSTPGEPMEFDVESTASTASLIAVAHVCQPLAIRPPQRLALRASRVRVEPLRVVSQGEFADLLLGDTVTTRLDDPPGVRLLNSPLDRMDQLKRT